jgi:biotin carboxyl carrier protein
MVTSPSVTEHDWPTSWAFERSYRALSYGFRVRSNVPRIGKLVDRLLYAFVADASTNGVTYSLLHREGMSPPFALFRDDVCIHQVEWPASMIDWVLSDTTTQAIDASDDYIAVHAGAVSSHGRGLILPAPPDSGKTTLVAALTRAGFSYLSDEVALIDPATGLLHPLPRPLAMDNGSLDAIPGLRSTLPRDHKSLMRYRFHIPPEDLRDSPVGGPCRVTHVIAPRFDSESTTTLTPLSRAATLMCLAENSFNARRFGSRGLRVLAPLVVDANGYELRFGNLNEAVERIAALMHAPASITPSREAHGEFPSFGEHLVVSPGWGRFGAQPIVEGAGVTQGTLLGTVTLGGKETPVLAPASGTLVAWLVWEGERVSPGRPLARLRPTTA